MIETTRPEMSVREPLLFVAFELGKKDRKLALTSGFGVEPWGEKRAGPARRRENTTQMSFASLRCSRADFSDHRYPSMATTSKTESTRARE